MKKLSLISILVFFLSYNLPGQTYLPGFKLATHFHETTFTEIGFNFYKVNSTEFWINKAWGPMIGIENNYKFNNREFIFAPKIGYDYFFNASLFQTGIHFIDYINHGNHDVRLSPEIGLSLLVLLNISYSYQINLTKYHLDDVGNNQLSLKINLIGMFNKKAKTFKFKKFHYKKRNT